MKEMEQKILGLEEQAIDTEKITKLQDKTMELERSVQTRDEQIQEIVSRSNVSRRSLRAWKRRNVSFKR